MVGKRGPTRDNIPESIQCMFADDEYNPAFPAIPNKKRDRSSSSSSDTAPNPKRHQIGYTEIAETYPKAFMRKRPPTYSINHQRQQRIYVSGNKVEAFCGTGPSADGTVYDSESVADVCCWWCCHKPSPTQKVVGCPVRFDHHTQSYQLEGLFCSWNCAAAHGISLGIGACGMFIQSIRRAQAKVGDGPLPPLVLARSRFTLKMFGGHLSIEQYRSGFASREMVLPSRLRFIPLGYDRFMESTEVHLPSHVQRRFISASEWLPPTSLSCDPASKEVLVKEAKRVYFHEQMFDPKYETRRINRNSTNFALQRTFEPQLPAFMHSSSSSSSSAVKLEPQAATPKVVAQKTKKKRVAHTKPVANNTKPAATTNDPACPSFKPGPAPRKRRTKQPAVKQQQSATEQPASNAPSPSSAADIHGRLNACIKHLCPKPVATSKGHNSAKARDKVCQMPTCQDVLQQEAADKLVRSVQVSQTITRNIDITRILQGCRAPAEVP